MKTSRRLFSWHRFSREPSDAGSVGFVTKRQQQTMELDGRVEVSCRKNASQTDAWHTKYRQSFSRPFCDTFEFQSCAPATPRLPIPRLNSQSEETPAAVGSKIALLPCTVHQRHKARCLRGIHCPWYSYLFVVDILSLFFYPLSLQPW